MNERAPAGLVARAEQMLGARVVASSRAAGGYTNAERWVLRCDDGRSVFAKGAVDEQTARWLIVEQRFCAACHDDFVPRLVGWDDPGDGRPLALFEDLSAAHWPPPWTGQQIARLQETLGRVAATIPPSWAPPLGSQRAQLSGWQEVARDRSTLLSLGLVSPAWLERALPALLAAESAVVLDGDALVHLDVRSDNVCFAADRVVLVDWNNVSRGNAMFDATSWLPSLHQEGGPSPWELCPDSEGFSALLSGYFASRAGLPTIPHAPRVREVQLSQLRSALAWAVRELDLPTPDGGR